MLVERRYIDVDGVQTAYVDRGEGTPVVLIHGGDPGRGGSGASIWYRNIADLARDHRVIAMDRLAIGHTANPGSPAGYRMSAICDHVERLLDLLQVRGAVVVGQSRGGFIAAHLARVRPDLVDSLVIANSASFAPKRPAKRQVTIRNFHGLPDTVADDERWLSVTDSHITPEWVEDVTHMLNLPKAADARRDFKTASEAYYQEVEELKADLLGWYRSGRGSQPSLVFWGIGDPSVGLQDGLDCFEVLQHGSAPARMHILAEAGHHCFAEYPIEFNETIRSFISTTRAIQEVP